MRARSPKPRRPQYSSASELLLSTRTETFFAPRAAKKAGFKQTTYGAFVGPFLPEAEATTAEEMVKMWATQPRRKLPFRYGYPDSEKHVHLMITEPKK